MNKNEVAAQRRAERKALANWTNPIGTVVEVTKDDKSKVLTKTRSMPWMLGTTPVILVEGIAGGYLLTRVRPVDSP
jgi:hypothetical protein